MEQGDCIVDRRKGKSVGDVAHVRGPLRLWSDPSGFLFSAESIVKGWHKTAQYSNMNCVAIA